MSSKRAVWYGLANLGYFLSYSTFNTYVVFFYTDQLHVSASSVTRAWLAFGVWNTVNDFLFGWLSDRLPAHLGRRTFFILIFSLPVAVAFALIWHPPGWVVAQGDGAMVWYFLLSVSCYDLLLTAMNTGQVAAFPELVAAGEDRSRVAAIRQAMAFVGTALGVAVTPLIYGRFGWDALGRVWGALVGILYLASVRGFSSSQVPVFTSKPPNANLGSLFRNPLFRSYIGIQLGIRFALAFLQLVLPFLVAHALRLSSYELSLVLAVMLGSAIIALPLWPRVVARWGLWQVGISIVGYLGLMLVPFLQVRDLASLLVLAALIGPGYGGISVVLDLVFALMVDADRQAAGESRAGIITGCTGTMVRLAPAFAGLILGEILTRAGYEPKLAVQPDSVGTALRVLMIVGPGVALAATGMLLVRFGRRIDANRG